MESLAWLRGWIALCEIHSYRVARDLFHSLQIRLELMWNRKMGDVKRLVEEIKSHSCTEHDRCGDDLRGSDLMKPELVNRFLNAHDTTTSCVFWHLPQDFCRAVKSLVRKVARFSTILGNKIPTEGEFGSVLEQERLTVLLDTDEMTPAEMQTYMLDICRNAEAMLLPEWQDIVAVVTDRCLAHTIPASDKVPDLPALAHLYGEVRASLRVQEWDEMDYTVADQIRHLSHAINEVTFLRQDCEVSACGDAGADAGAP